MYLYQYHYLCLCLYISTCTSISILFMLYRLNEKWAVRRDWYDKKAFYRRKLFIDCTFMYFIRHVKSIKLVLGAILRFIVYTKPHSIQCQSPLLHFPFFIACGLLDILFITLFFYFVSTFTRIYVSPSQRFLLCSMIIS